jgi:nitrate/TMAO reductase-like tetraheme cytochrome c subunit
MRYLFSALMVLLLVVPASAGYREAFEKEFLSKPWSHEIMRTSACVDCHTSDIIESDLQAIPQEWKQSWHFQNDISCHDCHGGDPEDAGMSMSHARGFVGSPEYADVPGFCGKCHIGILSNYMESGHGKALSETGTGPNCVTCHGSHDIQKASIDIIYGRRCTQCHSYERAKVIKQALFLTEKKMHEIEKDLENLHAAGVFSGDEKETLFRTQAEFRTLFHTIDASLVSRSTDEFIKRLDALEKKIGDNFQELRFRQKFSTFLMLIFVGMGLVLSLLSKTYRE